jgi:hypothetical protein
MKAPRRKVKIMKQILTSRSRLLQVTAICITMFAPHLCAADPARSFSSPDEAVTALTSAVRAHDNVALHSIFGAGAEILTNPDAIQATNEYGAFVAALNETNRVVRESETRCVLEVGHNLWPFPVPITQKDGRWFFDIAAGKKELLDRRIGRNELETLGVVRAYVQAQREYASRDRDGDEVLEYAQKFRSAPDLKDGLFWSPLIDGEISPLGPLVADAQATGYDVSPRNVESKPRPFHGYFFKILTRQGKSVPGGDYDYVINKNMIGGFALVAWPAVYGDSGIMTFVVNQQGRILQKDLGPKSAQVAAGFKTYNPDASWTASAD